MRGLYAIVDIDALERRGLDCMLVAEGLLAARPCALQLRAKGLGARQTLALLAALAPRCQAAHVPLWANDRPDLAFLAGCQGVHLGQADLPVSRARRLFPSLRFGVSTHNWAELERAVRCRPDYVAFGPVFATGSKLRPEPEVGAIATREAAAYASRYGIPLVAIGGLSAERVPSLLPDVGCVALISELLPAGGTTPRGSELTAEIGARVRSVAALLC